MTLAIALLALAISACGSLQPKHTDAAASDGTTALASATSPSQSTTTTSSPRPAASKAKARARHHSQSSGTPATTTGPSTTTSTTTSAVGVTPATTARKHKGPSPDACLTRAGLDRAHWNTQAKFWEANVGHTPDTQANHMVFVDGPYKSRGAADASARSIRQVPEYGARGGLYVVSATTRSKLSRDVHFVAACLDGVTASAHKGAGHGKSKGGGYTF